MINIKTRVKRSGTGYVLYIPKALVDCGIFKLNQELSIQLIPEDLKGKTKEQLRNSPVVPFLKLFLDPRKYLQLIHERDPLRLSHKYEYEGVF